MKEASRRCQKVLRKALFKYFDKDRHLESVVILSSSKDINLILKNIFTDYYIGQNTKVDFVKLLLSKNLEQSSLFSSAVSGIKNLYF